MPSKTQEEINHADSVNLAEFLMRQGENLVRIGNSYKMAAHDSLVITGNKWFWNSQQKGGKAISFIREYYNKSFVEAVDILNEGRTFGINHKNEIKPPTPPIPVKVKKIIQIDESPNASRALAYLSRTRGLDYNMVLDLVKQGSITQDVKNNVVFKIIDENGSTVGGERVGTSSDFKFKGIIPESAYGYGFEVCKGKGENALFFESSIDLLSYLQMYKNELDNHRLVSMIGVKSGTVESTIERYGIPPEKTFLCVDSDTAGQNFVKRLQEKYPSMHRISTVAPYKDWNEQLKSGNLDKTLDFSDLMCYNSKGDNDVDVNVVKNTYITDIEKVTSNSEEWKKFLEFSAELKISELQQEHNFSSKLLIYSENPNATDCKTFKEWKDEGNSVEMFSRGIPILTDTNGKHSATFVFDNSQTVKPYEIAKNHIIDTNVKAVMEALTNSYGFVENDVENLISNIVADEINNMNIKDNVKEMLQVSMCYEIYCKFGLDFDYDYDMFDGIEEMSVRDVAEMGVAMNKIAVPLENLIENTVILNKDRSIEHGELQEQGRDRVSMERGEATARSNVYAGEQQVVQTRLRNMDLPANDEFRNPTSRTGQVWDVKTKISQGTQTSRLADVDMGEQAVSALRGNQRGSTGVDREHNRQEVEVGGIQGSNRRLHEDSSSPSAVSNGSRGTSTDRDSISLTSKSPINSSEKAVVEDNSTSAFSSLYAKLESMALYNDTVRNNKDNFIKEDILNSLLPKIALAILHENILENAAFYNHFMTHPDKQKEIVQSVIEKSQPNIIKTEKEQPNINIVPQTNNKENDVKADLFADNKRTKNGDIVLGNTAFRYIPQKTYTNIDKDITADVVKQLEDNNIKFSGVIKGDTATLTVTASDLNKLNDVINNVSKASENIVETNEQKETPIQQEEPKEPVISMQHEEIKEPVVSVNDNQKHNIELGDVFLLNDNECAVTSISGLYPNDVCITELYAISGLQMNGTKNIDIDKLNREGEFLGNVKDMPEKAEKYNDFLPKSLIENSQKVIENTDEYAILDTDTLIIEKTEGYFPFEKVFDEDVLQANNIKTSIVDEEPTILQDSNILEETEHQFDFEEIEKIAAEPPIIEDEVIDTISENENIADIVEETSSRFKITDEHLGEGGAKEKFKNNIAAITTLKSIEADEREATPEEQEIMSKYVGWGGLSKAFDSNIPEWQNEFRQLRNILSNDEYEAAASSTNNAFYTSPVIIEAMYNALDSMGFEGGNILEPAMGIGNFFGVLPDKIANESQLMGVELDSISGRIAKQLYPEADISINGFEKMKFDNNQFDLAIGNVPFGEVSLFDKTKAYKNLKIHDYFFIKSADKIRSGGIMAFVTSKGTLDKNDNTVRKMLAQKCDLLGAIRLPDTAFKKNAGTDVTSDIIFLQKREKPLKESEINDCNWVHIGKSENGLPINQYFADNPQMVLGTLDVDYRGGTICKTIPEANLKEQLSEAIKNIKGEYTAPEFQPELNEKSTDILPATPDILNFTYTVVDEKLYYRRDDDLVPLKEAEQTGTKADRRKGMCEIADTVKTLLNAQVENRPDDEIQKLQNRLNKQYDDYSSKFGYFNKIANKNPNSLFKNDVRFPLLQSIEKTDGEKFLGKADIFTKRTITPHKAVEHTDTSSEALIVSVSEKAKVDLDYMSELTGFDKDKIVSDLHGVIFPVPELSNNDNIVYQSSEEYLSGNIYEKLENAINAVNENPIFKDNIQALEIAKPEPLSAGDIKIKLGVTWIDPKIIEQFMHETFGTQNSYKQYNNASYQHNPNAIELSYSESGKGAWNITNKTIDRNNLKVSNTFGTKDMNAYQILENVLNATTPKIYEKKLNDEGKEVSVINKKATALVNQKVQEVKNAFDNWVFKDPIRRDDLVSQYNELFNCIKPREYDGSHLKFSGMNPEIKLRPHQENAIAHALFGGNTLFAHEVGAGKTYEMIASAMEGKRLGLHNKALFAVPNHLTEQIGTDFMKLYPNANILVAKPDDFSSNNRKKMCAKIATGNFDAVIVGHSQLIKIPLSPEREQKFIKDQINEITSSIESAKKDDGSRFTVKQLEKTKASLQEKFNKLVNSTTKDQTVTFEELGIDKLIVDEAHMFKNLFIATKMNNIAGISTNDGVQKTQDLYMKCQYLDEKTGGKGVIFATGTPISNSMTEIYSMQKYLQSSELEKHKIKNFDSWAANFGDTVTAGELAPEGNKYKLRTRFAKFVNIPELMNIFKQCADIKTADVLDLKVPNCEKINVSVEPSEFQKNYVKKLSERAEMVQNGLVEPKDDNMLVITNDGRKLGLDQRLINPKAPDDPNSKLNNCVKNVFDIWDKTAADKSTQLIFCDLGVPQSKEDIKKNGVRFCVYDDIKEKLIAKGVPEKEIAFIHDAGDSEVKKAQMFAKVRNGDIRVLIGSTSKMGAGTNVQNKLIASHDLDCPWKPSDMTQRAGRMIRQGNDNKEVQLFRYVTEKTFDAYLFQTLEKKQNFIGQIMTSKCPARVCDDVDEQALDYAEIKALCAGDPRIKERMELDIDVSRLKLLKSGFMTQQYAVEDNILKVLPKQIANAENAINGMKNDIVKASSYAPPRNAEGEEQFTIKLDGKVHTDKAEAGKAIQELATKSAISNMDKAVVVGEYKDFPLAVSFDSYSKNFNMHIQGDITHSTDMSSSDIGNITKLNNLFSAMDKKLSNLESNLEQYKTNLENGKLEIGKPFEFEATLVAKETRLMEITADLEENPVSDIGSEKDDVATEKAEVSDNIKGDTVSVDADTKVEAEKPIAEPTSSAPSEVPTVPKDKPEIADNKPSATPSEKPKPKEKPKFTLELMKSEAFAPRSTKNPAPAKDNSL